MTNLLPVSRVVSVAVEMSPRAAAARNFGSMLILGASDVIDASERIREYSLITEVASDFGVDAPEYLAALAYFSQSPKPKTLFIGRWVKTNSAGLLRGKILPNARVEDFTGVVSGTITAFINGLEVSASGISLTGVTNLNGVASVISSRLSGATCVWDGTRFILRSATTGVESSVTNASGDLAVLMGLADGKPVGGATAETIQAAVSKMLDNPSWYGLFVADTLSTAQCEGVAALVSAAEPSRIVAFTSQDSNELDATATDTLGARMKALGYNRVLVMYSSHTPYAAMSVLGRMASVKFEGTSTCITLKFKQCPSVIAENLTTSQANALKSKNVNTFASYQNDTAILQEGIMSGGWFIDETHGLDWLENHVQTTVYNLLYTSTTKIGQDEAGATALVSAVCRALAQGVTNGLISAGVWGGAEFGSLHTGDTLSAGYYVYIQPFEEQSQADREARKAPPINVAVKLKGAIHFVDCTITVNR